MTQDMTSQQVTLLEGLYSLYRSGTLTDVTLRTSESGEIRCHRNVLAASSPYFRAMFTSQVRERDEKEIFLQAVSHSTLHLVISFMYTGRLELTNENVQDIFMTASMFEMLSLLDLCAARMVQELCITNCIDVYNFGSHFFCTKLRESARVFILEHFSSIAAESDKLLELDFEDFLDIISSDGIYVEKEEFIYETIVSWINFDHDARCKYLPKLFKEVRLVLVSEEFIENDILQNDLIMRDAFCREILTFHKLSNLQDQISTLTSESLGVAEKNFGLNTTPRLGMFNRTMVVFSGGGNGMDERSFTAYEPVSRKNYMGLKPHPTFDFKFKIDYFQLISTDNNRIYFLGGIFYDNHHFEDAGTSQRDVLEYNMREVRWEKRAPMNTARCCFSACCYKNSLFVIGGKSTYPRGEPTNSVEVYDPETDYWTRLSPVPIPIYNHACAVIGDAIFVFGGKDEDDQFLDTVFRYDIPRDSWSLVTTQMPKSRAQFSALAYKRRIYLIGGSTLHENILRVDIYDPDKNTWCLGEDFPEERKITSAAIQGGSIFLCGGVRYLGLSGRRSRKVESKDLYRYNIEKHAWVKEVKLVQFGNAQACAVAVLNTQYLQASDFISSGG